MDRSGQQEEKVRERGGGVFCERVMECKAENIKAFSSLCTLIFI